MKKLTALIILIFVSVLFSCKTVMSRVDTAPVWSLHSSRNKMGRVLVDSMGISTDQQAALEQAGINWDGVFIKGLGIDLEKEGELTAEQQAFLNRITQKREEALNSMQSLSGMISMDRVNYIEEKDSEVEIYLLCSLSLDDYSELKMEADSLFDIVNPLYDNMEKEAEKSVKDGEVFDGVLEYIKAADLSLKDLPLNGDLFYYRYIKRAAELLSGLSLVPVELPSEGRVDSSLTTPLTYDVQSNGIPFIVLFDQESPDGTIKRRKAQLHTSKSGFLSFYYPTPSTPGNYTMAFSFNKDVLPQNTGLPEYCAEVLKDLYSAADKLSSSHAIEFYQDVKQIPTLIISRESDITGKVLTSQWVSKEFEKILKESVYNVTLSTLDSSFSNDRNREELIRDLRYLFKEDYQRVVILDSRIVDYKQNQDLFTLSASCSMDVLNLVKGTVIFSFSDEASITLQDQRNMLPSVFSQLGRKMAEDYTQ